LVLRYLTALALTTLILLSLAANSAGFKPHIDINKAEPEFNTLPLVEASLIILQYLVEGNYSKVLAMLNEMRGTPLATDLRFVFERLDSTLTTVTKCLEEAEALVKVIDSKIRVRDVSIKSDISRLDELLIVINRGVKDFSTAFNELLKKVPPTFSNYVSRYREVYEDLMLRLNKLVSNYEELLRLYRELIYGGLLNVIIDITSVEPVEVEVGSEVIVKGYLTDANANPLPNRYVTALLEGIEVCSNRTDYLGRFTLRFKVPEVDTIYKTPLTLLITYVPSGDDVSRYRVSYAEVRLIHKFLATEVSVGYVSEEVLAGSNISIKLVIKPGNYSRELAIYLGSEEVFRGLVPSNTPLSFNISTSAHMAGTYRLLIYVKHFKHLSPATKVIYVRVASPDLSATAEPQLLIFPLNTIRVMFRANVTLLEVCVGNSLTQFHRLNGSYVIELPINYLLLPITPLSIRYTIKFLDLVTSSTLGVIAVNPLTLALLITPLITYALVRRRYVGPLPEVVKSAKPLEAVQRVTYTTYVAFTTAVHELLKTIYRAFGQPERYETLREYFMRLGRVIKAPADELMSFINLVEAVIYGRRGVDLSVLRNYVRRLFGVEGG